MPPLYDNLDVGISEHQLLVNLTVLIISGIARDLPILKKVHSAVVGVTDTIIHSNNPRR